ncbi:MAG: hypothetical protein MUC85_01230 [Anaerolineales bacterium]|nr:hypothetical protein [Anaerolineales bacterium]
MNLSNLSSVWIGLIFFLVFFLLVLAFTLLGKKRPVRYLREIPAYIHLRRQAGLSVEAGTRLHVSLGRGGIIGLRSGVAMVGLAVLDRVARAAMISDRPPLATSGESMLSILAQDGIRNAYRSVKSEAQLNPDSGRLTGLTPLSYAAGVMTLPKDERISTHILVGNFGSEAALIADAAERNGDQVVAGSDQPAAQAVLFAAASDPLIGEEVYAGGAYLSGSTSHAASLRAQDVLRWLIILVIITGAVLKLVGWL